MNINAETCRYRHMRHDARLQVQVTVDVVCGCCEVLNFFCNGWFEVCKFSGIFTNFKTGCLEFSACALWMNEWIYSLDKIKVRWCSACLLIQYDTVMLWLCRVLVEPKPLTSVRPRPASSAALSTMNNKHNASSSPPSSHHLSVLTKVLRMFRSHSDPSVPRPPSPPRRRAAPAGGPHRSSSASPCTAAAQQQQVSQFAGRQYVRSTAVVEV